MSGKSQLTTTKGSISRREPVRPEGFVFAVSRTLIPHLSRKAHAALAFMVSGS